MRYIAIIILLFPVSLLSINISVGTYTGNGTSQSITGLGFQPEVLFINSEAAEYAVWRPSSMAGDSSFNAGQVGTSTNAITALDADGFTVGSNAKANGSGETLHYLAIAGDEVVTGKYKGNSANRTISGLGITVNLMFVQRTVSYGIRVRNSTVEGDSTFCFANEDWGSNQVKALGSGSFDLGTAVQVNQNGLLYHYVVIEFVEGFVGSDSYSGDGNDDRSISGIGFQPDIVFAGIDVRTISQFKKVWRDNEHIGDDSDLWHDDVVSTNYIQALEADGFQVGTHGSVNNLGSRYMYTVFKEGNSASTATKKGQNIILIF